MQSSLVGVARLVEEISSQYDARAERKEMDFRMKEVASCHRRPELKLFPWPLQLKIEAEMEAAHILIKERTELWYYPDEKRCDCLFFRKFFVPCRHLLQRDMLYDHLTSNDWKNYSEMFEDSGMEVYELFSGDNTELGLPKDLDEEAAEAESFTQDARILADCLRNAYLNHREATEHFNPTDRKAARKYFLMGLGKAIGPFLRAASRDFILGENIGMDESQSPQDLVRDLNLGHQEGVDDRAHDMIFDMNRFADVMRSSDDRADAAAAKVSAIELGELEESESEESELEGLELEESGPDLEWSLDDIEA